MQLKWTGQGNEFANVCLSLRQHAGHTTQEDNEDVLFEPLLNADVFIYQLCTSSAKSFFGEGGWENKAI